MRGRKAEPPATKSLKTGQTPPAAAPGRAVPEPPYPLGPVARAEWDRFGPTLAADGRLSDETSAAFALYCQTYARYCGAMLEVETHGNVIFVDNGAIKANPAAAVVKDCLASMGRFHAAFGLTPADRNRLGLARGVAEVDSLALFLEG